MKTTIPAFRFVQGGCVYYMCVMLSETIGVFRRLPYNPNLPPSHKHQGFNRQVNKKRVDDARKYFSKVVGTVCPAILVNDREGTCVFKKISDYGGHMQYGMLTMTPEDLDMIDGQHRQVSISELMGYPVPVMIGTDLDMFIAMNKFITVNTTQKNVPTDLCSINLLRLAKERGMADFDEYQRNRALAEGILIALNNSKDGPWFHGFILPTQKKIGKKEIAAGTKERYCKSASFADSLIKQQIISKASGVLGLIDEDDDVGKQVSKLAPVVEAFWIAIEKMLPTCFEQPTGYVLQGALGAYVMHRVLSRCMDLVEVSDESDMSAFSDPNTYRKLLRGISVLQDATKWDNEGEIGMYGSSQKSARGIYTKYFEKQLPKKFGKKN